MGDRELYVKLERLYAGKATGYDSLSRGYEIEKLVSRLIREIASPLRVKSAARYGKHEFDGEVAIGRQRSILYEIFTGGLSEFRYESLLSLVRSIYFPRRVSLLIIARDFSYEDEERIDKLVDRVVTDEVNMRFMSHETLISLHRFCSSLEIDPSKDLKITKRLFLQALVDIDVRIISEDLFAEAIEYAENRYYFELQEPLGDRYPVARQRTLAERHLSDHQFQRLESTLERLLHEIGELRRDLREYGQFPGESIELRLKRLVQGLTDFQREYLTLLLDEDDWIYNRDIGEELAKRGRPNLVSRSIGGMRAGLTRKAAYLNLDPLDESEWDQDMGENRYRINYVYREQLRRLLL